MDSMSVTLDEVIAAARARAASLVPETSGYLALAVADASARLPFLVEDPLVTLSTEGTVHVKRGSRVAEPADSAFVMRDMLGRLLSLSIGSAPALAGAARTRSTSDAVDVFIHELENALVPVNRAAARRALARLARETVRAKEAGRLRRRRRAEPSEIKPEPVAPSGRPDQPSQPPTMWAASPRRPAPAPPPPAPPPPVVAATKEPTPAPVEVDVEEFSATPHEPPAFAVSDATTIDTEYAERVLLLEPMRHSDVGGPARSDVDELARQFSVTSQPVDGSHRLFKSLAGMDPTPPPPQAQEIAALVARVAPPASPSEPLNLVVRKARIAEQPRLELRPSSDLTRAEPRVTKPDTSRSAAAPPGTPAPRSVAFDDAEEALLAEPTSEMPSTPARGARWPMVVALLLGFGIAAGLGHFVPSWLAMAENAREP